MIFKSVGVTLVLLVSVSFLCMNCMAAFEHVPVTPVTTDSRLRTLVYSPNAVYSMTFHYGYHSFIKMASDENIEIISLGQAYSWRITPVPEYKVVFVRPLQIGASTNMIIVTDKRIYFFDITSKAYDGRSDADLIYAAKFVYPNNSRAERPSYEIDLTNPIQEVKDDVLGFSSISKMSYNDKKKLISGQEVVYDSTKIKGGKIDLDNLDKDNKNENVFNDEILRRVTGKNRDDVNFNYSASGYMDDAKIDMVFDDEAKTYFLFSNDTVTIPSIYAVNIETGDEVRQKYHIDGDYIVVNNVNAQFSMRLGSSLMCIFNNKLLPLSSK